jgi:hypothetical protein
MVLTAPKDIQEVEMILAAESHGEHGEAKHDVAADGKRMTWSKSHNEVVATQGATTTTTTTSLMALIMS